MCVGVGEGGSSRMQDEVHTFTQTFEENFLDFRFFNTSKGRNGTDALLISGVPSPHSITVSFFPQDVAIGKNGPKLKTTRLRDQAIHDSGNVPFKRLRIC